MKKLFALLLTLALLLSLMPTVALAEGSCADGTVPHDPHLDAPQITPDCEDGYHFEHYRCMMCSSYCRADGSTVDSSEWEEAITSHTLNWENPCIDPDCVTGFHFQYYICTVCNDPFRADGTELQWSEREDPLPNSHTPDVENPRIDPDCQDGYHFEWYYCTVWSCYAKCDADGTELTDSEQEDALTSHTPDWNNPRIDPDCEDGYHFEYYECSACQSSCHADGTLLNYDSEWEEAIPGSHTLDLEHPDIDPDCQDGYHFQHYQCTGCWFFFHADGTDIDWDNEWEEALTSHALDLDDPMIDPDCQDGYHFEHYRCMMCGSYCRADGTTVDYDSDWEDALTDVHTPDLENPYSADPDCQSGYHFEYYQCIDCYADCHADGTKAEREDAITSHTLDLDNPTVDPDCMPGYHFEHYHCAECGGAFRADGTEVDFSEQEWPLPDSHTPDLDNPRIDSGCYPGYHFEYYQCIDCYADCHADGTTVDHNSEWDDTTTHTPNLEYSRIDPDCADGYHFEYYYCSNCSSWCRADGTGVQESDWEEAVTDIHNPNTEEPYMDPDCQNGYHFEHYQCIDCYADCRADGTELTDSEREEALTNIHKPNLDKPMIDPDCTSGLHFIHYYCTECYETCDADGVVIDYESEWEEALTDVHTPAADVTDILGESCHKTLSSSDTRVYICKCGYTCDQNGERLEYIELDSPAHDWVLHRAEDQNANSCIYYAEDYYQCSKCGEVCGVAADSTADPESYPDCNYPEEDAEVNHNMIHFPGNSTRKDCWKCLTCRMISLDANGTQEIWEEYLARLIIDGDTNVTEPEEPTEPEETTPEEPDTTEPESTVKPEDTTNPEETTKPSEYDVELEVSINPRFTIYVAKDGTVLSVDFMNEDAESLKAEIRTSGITAEECIADILAAAKKHGFFDDTPAMTIKVTDSKISETELNTLLESIQNVDTGDVKDLNIKILNADGSEYTKEPENTEKPVTKPDTNPDSPSTGDIDLLPIFAIMLCSALGLLAVIFWNKKKTV